MKSRLVAAIGSLITVAGALFITSPPVAASPVSDTQTCYYGTDRLVVTTIVTRYADYSREVRTNGYGVHSNGVKFQVYGPSQWRDDTLIYRRQAWMITSYWYGVNIGPAEHVLHWYSSRVFISSGTKYCDSQVYD